MSSLALINEFLGQPPNASEHGYQIDHIIEFAHWFMGALFVGWSAFFVFVLIRFRRSRHPKADHAGVKSGISTLADVPSEGSGLGSSSSILVGLLNALYAYQGEQVTAEPDAPLAPR